MTPPALDPAEILRALARYGVDYVLVGGVAVQAHGHVRTTVDIDVIPRPERANLNELAKALRDLEARALNPGAPRKIDADTLGRATLWQFDTRHGALDVLHEAPGAPPYEELRARAVEVQLGDTHVAVVGLDDLIRMKLASGRPEDLADVAALTEPSG